MFSPRAVTSDQNDIHPDLAKVVQRHLAYPFLRPSAPHTQAAWNEIKSWFCGDNLILDSGCGQGESTYNLALRFPQHKVLGVDKSAVRVAASPPLPANGRIIRADVVDLWGLMVAAEIKLAQHCVFYPNPWPKKAQLQRRWHGHPAWRWLLQLGGQLELRTNWEIYAQEFAAALEISQCPRPAVQRWWPHPSPITQFERKYHRSGQLLYKVSTIL